jgi:putative aldouronate transport system substrate-binding protein
MNTKHTLIMFGGFLAVFGLLFLVPDNPKSKNLLARPSPVAWNEVEDDPSVTLPISWLGITGYSGGRDDSWIERNLEKEYNLDLRPVFMDPNAYLRRRPLMFADGDIPDVIWVAPPLMGRTHAKNAFVMEIPYSVICSHAPTYARMVNKYAPETWLQAQYQGKNFALPTFFIEAQRPTIGGWRMDWLRNVGIDRVPETIDEMEEALRRFRHDDPDGNGVKDTYGYCPDAGNWWTSYTVVFLAYDLLPFDFIMRDGKVCWGGIQPAAKEALGRLRRWYGNGLIDPDYILSARSNMTATKFLNGQTGFIYPKYQQSSYDLGDSNSFHAKLKALNPEAEMVPARPLIARSGCRRGRSWGAAGHMLQFGRQLEKHPKKVIRVLRMLEAIASSKEQLQAVTHGQRGVHWDISEDEGIHLLSPFSTDRALQKRELLRGGAEGSLFYFPSGIAELYPEHIPADERKFNATYRDPKWSLSNAIGKADVLPSAERHVDYLRSFQMKVYAEIISGERPLDYFEDFVRMFMAKGGKVLTKEANEAQNKSKVVQAEVQAILERAAL